MIRLSGITKQFSDGEERVNNVLRGVDLHVERGEMVAIKGPSGSGKSTLLNILGTQLYPDKGRYLFDEREIDIPGVDYSRFRNQSIGFVFQDHRLLPQLTILQNILLPTLAFSDRSTDEEIARAHSLLQRVGLVVDSTRMPSTLSGGESQRVALCRALIMKPKAVLADEPTGQLDRENALTIARLLHQMSKEEDVAIVMVSHSDEVSSVADRIYNLADGVLK